MTLDASYFIINFYLVLYTVTFALEKKAPRFGDLFNFEKPYLLNRWAHSAQQISKVY